MITRKFLQEQKKTSSQWLRIAIGLGLCSSLLLILQAWFLANVINSVIFEQAKLYHIQGWLWLMLIVFIVRAFLTWASNHASFQAAAKIKLHLRDRIHRHIQAIGPVHSARERSGANVNILVDGIEALENYYARYLPAISFVVLVPPAILIIIFPLDWISGLVLLMTAPIIPFFMIMIGRGAEKLNKKQWRTMARMSSHFLDTIQGLTTLKIFNASRREAAVIAKVSDEYRGHTMSVLRVAFLSSLLLEFFSSIGIALVAVLIGFRLLHGDMTFLAGFFVLILAPDFYLPLRNMGTHYHARMDGIGAAEQMVKILAVPVPVSKQNSLKGGSDFPAITGQSLSITFKNINFAYEKDRPALSGFNLSILAGQRVALIGESGAGKSTVINLLLGFVQTGTGKIFINNHDLSTIPLARWREQIAWLPQRPYLFHGTIADNIRMGKSGATEQEIKEAARLANCDEFIEEMVNGYQSHIGEQGLGLSGGQIQRVALARAFLKDAPLLILDEAAANLDRHSEQLIEKSIELLAKDRTVIIIAHRLHTIGRAKQIVVMEQGRILASGSHRLLMEESRAYRDMINNYKKIIEIPQPVP
jgi:ATP-binding cassette subfamily C protein CydD